MASTLYFAAVDYDCDGPSTTLYRTAIEGTIDPAGCLSRELWDSIFDGSHYFGPSDCFVIPVDAVVNAMEWRDSIFGGAPEWTDHGKYAHATVKGIVDYNG
jgi:hypothetical protein